MRLQNVLDLAFNAIDRFRLQIMYGGEVLPEVPWMDTDPDTGQSYAGSPLVIPPGLVWYDNSVRTIRFLAEQLDTLDSLTPDTFFVARRVQAFVDVAAFTPVTVTHGLGQRPLVQAMQALGGDEHLVYDIEGNGGQTLHESDFMSTTFLFGDAFEGLVVFVG